MPNNRATNDRPNLTFGATAFSALALLVGLVVLASLPVTLHRGCSPQGTTPLFQARTAQEAEALIAAGADVNARSQYGCTPIHFAAGRGLPDVVRALLAHGANARAANVDGETPLHWAAREFWDADEGAHAILDPTDPVAKTEAARLLIAAGADVNAENSAERTPLFDAARDNLALVQLLLDSGAASDPRSVDGFSPLHHTYSAQVARLLLDRGADPNARDRWEGRTPLYFADNLGDPELRAVLIARGAKK